MERIKRSAGRPKGSKKSKTEKDEVRSIYNPETEEAKAIYIKNELEARARRKYMSPSKFNAKRTMLRSLLQKRYYSEFQVVGYNKFGEVKEHPVYKALGKLMEIGKSRGSSIREAYFPELYQEKKEARKLASDKRYVKKHQLTAHDLRMGQVDEEYIKLIFS